MAAEVAIVVYGGVGVSDWRALALQQGSRMKVVTVT